MPRSISDPRDNAKHGPFKSAAHAIVEVAHIYDASHKENRRGTMAHINEGLLLAALNAANVQLDTYDKRVAGWLADWEPELVHVIIGWIERAA